MASATVQKVTPGFEGVAAPINAAIPPREKLYAIRPGFQPYLFYIRAPVRYVNRLGELPSAARYVLVDRKFQTKLEGSAEWSALQLQLLARTKEFRGKQTLFYLAHVP